MGHTPPEGDGVSLQRFPGSFQQNSTAFWNGILLADGPVQVPLATNYSAGAIRVAPIAPGPSLSSTWTIIGWTIRLRVAFSIAAIPPSLTGLWARFGDLWAGLAIDSPLQNQNGNGPANNGLSVGLPSDLSSFTKVWTPDEPIRYAPWQSNAFNDTPRVRAQDCQIMGTTFMLPSPVNVPPGTAMQMVLLLTPWLGPYNGNLLVFVVQSCDFTVLYEFGNK